MPQRQMIIRLLLGALCLGAIFYLRGLASSLRLGDASVRGFLLVPSLPMPLYATMAAVMAAGVGLTLFAGFLQRRRRASELEPPRAEEPLKTPWQAMLSMLVSGVIFVVCVVLLLRHNTSLRRWLAQWRHNMNAAPGFLAESTRSLLRQVDSPTAGYAMFVVVILVYGGLALLGLWVLLGSRNRRLNRQEQETPQARRVRRAVSAGLRELRQHANPRQAIIACYARLEYLLEDYGVPAYRHLTPQEYMGVALRGVDLPLEPFAGLVELFEQARYSLHPLDDTAREEAIGYLEVLQNHLEWGGARAQPI